MSGQKAWRDWVYLAVVGLQLFGMLVLDLAPYYPEALWKSPSAPLHFLVTFRAHHVSTSGDPFFAGPHRAWFEGLLYIEAFAQLPLAAYLVSQLALPTPSKGTAEIAGLAFGCLTAMGSIACCAELAAMGSDELSLEKRATVLYAMYMPYAVIPGLMAVDMYARLLRRVQAAEAKTKTL